MKSLATGGASATSTRERGLGKLVAQQAERAIEQAEAAMAALELELSDPEAWKTEYETGKNQARHTAARLAVEAACTRLEAVIE